MILHCCKSIPMSCLLHIPFNTDCIFVEPSQITLPISIAMLCCTTSPIQCFYQVLLDSEAIIVKVTYLTLSKGIPLFRKN